MLDLDIHQQIHQTQIKFATTQSIFNIANVQGFSGIITGIAPATGSNGETAIKFMYNSLKDYTTLGKLQNGNATGTLVAGYPIVISDTKVGNGVNSVYSADGDIVSIGTTFDNITLLTVLQVSLLTRSYL